MPTSTPPDAGEDRRDAALTLLRQRRGSLVRRGQHALLRQLLATGTATADDVRAVVELPPNISPKLFGAVPGPLAEAGIIMAAGYVPTTRAKLHARPVMLWRLADQTRAIAWLDANPEIHDGGAVPETPAQRHTLFDE